jgi:hypothetical protein
VDSKLIKTFIFHLKHHKKSHGSLLSYENGRVLCFKTSKYGKGGSIGQVTDANYLGLLWLKPLIKALMRYHERNKPFISVTARNSMEHRYLKSCLLLAHVAKEIGIKPTLVFYLRYSRHWTNGYPMRRVYISMVALSRDSVQDLELFDRIRKHEAAKKARKASLQKKKELAQLY